MNRIKCCYCYSDKYITYSYQNFICKNCNKILSKCDICNLYCNNTCLSLFDKILTL